MLNRRFLRVKVLQELYAFQQSNETDLAIGEQQLLTSIDKLYELFVWQLSFLVEVKRFAEMRIEENKHKNFPTQEDLDPNMRFVNNRVLNVLEENRSLLKLEDRFKVNWAEHREDLIRKFYNRLREYPEYTAFMENEEDSFEIDRDFVLSIIDNYISEDDLIFDFFSDANIFFNSDYQLCVLLVWKFISEMSKNFGINDKIPTIYKTEDDEINEDKLFIINLFRKTVLHKEEYVEIISKSTSNWEHERIAVMDMLILEMALAEFFEFRSVPVKVTINEYIEISKYYSTPDSKRFINGLLDKLSTSLKAEGKIVKTGRGLIGG